MARHRRWPAVQAFAGSLEGHRARKGVMITTSTFSQEAKDYVQKIEKKIVLVDGKQLAQLMIEHDVGVTVTRVYARKSWIWISSRLSEGVREKVRTRFLP